MYALLPCVKERAASIGGSSNSIIVFSLHDDERSSGGARAWPPESRTYEPPLPTSRRFLDRQHHHGGQPAANEVASLYLSVSVGLSVSLYVYVPVYLSVLSACLSVVCLSICVYIYICPYVSICAVHACVLSVCLSVPVHINNAARTQTESPINLIAVCRFLSSLPYRHIYPPPTNTRLPRCSPPSCPAPPPLKTASAAITKQDRPRSLRCMQYLPSWWPRPSSRNPKSIPAQQ